MITGDYAFDMNAATAGSRHEYGDTYSISNEPLDWAIPLTPVAGRRVLTVAASGDQPLMYAAHGAKQIDTFDLTYNAHVITDFKTTALRFVDCDKYKAIVSQLYNLIATDRKHHDALHNIIRNMPADTGAAMTQFLTASPSVFCREEAGRRVPFPVDDAQYAAMRKNVRRPFNFVWADLMRVPQHLTQQYDIINISNIFDHYRMADRNDTEIVRTLAQLWPHIAINGHLICMGMYHFNGVLGLLESAVTNSGMGTAKLHESPEDFWQALIIQKVR